MVNEIKRTVSATTSLTDLNTIVQQEESMLGALMSMGNNGSKTALSFDTDAPVASYSTITADVGGNPQPPAGRARVCSGTIYISGALSAATAFR